MYFVAQEKQVLNALKEPFQTSKFVLDFLLHKRYDYGLTASHKNLPTTSIWPYMIMRPVCKKVIGTRLDYRPIVKWDVAISILNPDNTYVNILDIYKQEMEAIGYDTNLDWENEKFFNTDMLRDLLPIIPPLNTQNYR